MVNATCTFCEHEFDTEMYQNNIVCPNCNAMLGYWEKEELEKIFPKNYVLIVPKNTPYHSTFIGWTVTRKKYNIKLHHWLPGSMTYEWNIHRPTQEVVFQSNPQITWVGASSYWKSADVNYFRTFKGGWEKEKCKLYPQKN